MARNPASEAIAATGVVVVARLRRPLPDERLFHTCAELSIPVEITLDSPGCLAAVSAASSSSCMVGVGTVLDRADARRAVDAGARFLVSPAVCPDVANEARAHGVLAVPGALTPTEVLAAHRVGGGLVKLFPARLGGPRYVADVLAPLDVPLLVTGGVAEADVPAFIRAGAVAVGLGTSYVDDDVIAAPDHVALATTLRRVRDLVMTARAGG